MCTQTHTYIYDQGYLPMTQFLSIGYEVSSKGFFFFLTYNLHRKLFFPLICLKAFGIGAAGWFKPLGKASAQAHPTSFPSAQRDRARTLTGSLEEFLLPS